MANPSDHRFGERYGSAPVCDCCMTPFSRRQFVAGIAATAVGGFAASWGGEASANEGLLEPRLTLKTPQDGRRTVALTLDACPGGFDAKIIAALVEWRVPATLFVTGAWMHSNPAGLAALLAHPDLFAFGNHGAHHVPAILGERRIFGLRVAGDLQSIRDEVGRGEEAIMAATGAKPVWYRGATALYSPAAVPAIEGMGFSIAGYSLNADMGASLPAEAVMYRMRQAKDGDVIIAHTNQPNRPSGAGVIAGVRALLDQDVRFVRLDALTQSVASM
ncbi:MAG: polysaccharide deacetylase [Alphaproteobacteria bacterium]|nr:polysaccharide deacetylase family protein [Beijerinckiaceae bacterium]NBQ38320.1 polysaccharide deacetylase [Alphaproteobacteria bacterium]